MSNDPLSPARLLFDRMLPDSFEALLTRALGRSLPRKGEDGRLRISSCGRFSGRIAADLLAFVKNQKYDGAFVLLQDDTVRVLYAAHGLIVAADSNVLFERLGRVLHRAGTLDRESSRTVVNCEEQRGLAAAVQLLPPEAVLWGLDKRVWEIGTALSFMAGAYFLFVDGEPGLGDLPRVSIAPMELAIEGLRRYDEWRNTTAAAAAPTPGPEAARVAALAEESLEDLAAAPGSTPRRLTGKEPPHDVDDIMRLLSE
jgi:hypothetical protein